VCNHFVTIYVLSYQHTHILIVFPFQGLHYCFEQQSKTNNEFTLTASAQREQLIYQVETCLLQGCNTDAPIASYNLHYLGFAECSLAHLGPQNTWFNELTSIRVSAYFQLFLGAFAKLQKATISFVMSVLLSAWNSSAPIGRILMLLNICTFLENLWSKFKFH